MKEDNDRALFYVLSALREEIEELELHEENSLNFTGDPWNRAFLESSVADLVQQGKGREWLNEAASLYQSDDRAEVSFGGELLSLLIKKDMAEEVGAEGKTVKQAVKYWLNDDMVEEAAEVLIPLADKGQSTLLVKPLVFERCSQMLTSNRASIALPAYHLVRTMAEDGQARSIESDPKLMPTIVENYLNDGFDKLYRSEHILEELIKDKRTIKNTIEVVQDDCNPVLERTRDLLTKPKYENNARIFAAGLATTALTYSDNREDVEAWLGKPAIKNAVTLSKNWAPLLPPVRNYFCSKALKHGVHAL